MSSRKVGHEPVLLNDEELARKRRNDHQLQLRIGETLEAVQRGEVSGDGVSSSQIPDFLRERL